MRTKIIILALLAVLLTLLITYNTGNNPQRAGEYFTKGKKMYSEDKIDEAIRLYKKGLRSDSDSSEGHNLLGMAYRAKYFKDRKKEDYLAKAIDSFKRSIEKDPKNWYPYVNLGTTYYYSGNKKEASVYLKKVLEVNPSHPEAARLVEMIDEGEKER